MIYKTSGFRLRRRKRQGTRRRRRVQRRTRIYKTPTVRVMNYKREFLKAQVGGGGGAAAMSFKLSDVPNYASFVNMFDQYRIMCVVYKFVPYVTSNSLMSAGDTFNGYNVVGMDFNDANAPGTQDDVLKLRYHRCFPLTKYFTYKIKPKAEMSFYNTTLTTGYGNASRKIWVDTTNAAIPYYGLKFYYTNASVPISFVGEIYLTYYVQFRNVQL